jgi:hypothetical protein
MNTLKLKIDQKQLVCMYISHSEFMMSNFVILKNRREKLVCHLGKYCADPLTSKAKAVIRKFSKFVTEK